VVLVEQAPPWLKALGRWNVASVVAMVPASVVKGWSGHVVAVAVAVRVPVAVGLVALVGVAVLVMVGVEVGGVQVRIFTVSV
jgi:hypothetical protein